MREQKKEKSERQKVLEQRLRRVILWVVLALILPKERDADPGGAAGSRRKSMVKRLVRRLLVIVFVVMVLILGIRHLLSDELEVTFYHLYSPKISGAESIRIVVLSDLHNREFGEGNAGLIAKIASLKPDLIVMAGDMVNGEDEDLDVILHLCDGLTEVAPIYYSPGNHENHLLYEKGSPLESLLLEKGIHVLINRAEEITVHRTAFMIGGLTTSPEGYGEYGEEFIGEYEKSDGFKLLISHYPSLYYEALAGTEIDLGVCGHYHGGLVRLPFVGGLYHRDTGFFPRYSGGMYQLPYSTVFVSRGLEDHSGFPRVNNRPELAVIDINGRQETDFPGP